MEASQQGKLSLWRRFGRLISRMIRPVSAPIMHRFRLHVQNAVDIAPLAMQMHALRSETNGELGRVLEMLSRFDSGSANQAERLDRLQVGIDALRRDFHQGEALASLLQANEKLTALLARAETCGKEQAKNFELATVVLSRVDALLHRVNIPVGQELLTRTPYGFLLIPMEDRGLITGIWENGGLLEQGTVKVLTGLLKQGDHVIDVGANIGLLTLPAAVSVGPTGRVIAVEPASRAFSLLRESVAINFEAGRVNLQNCAAGAAAGKATLNLGHHIGHSSLLTLDADGGKEEVEVAPLDALTTPGQRVDLVKIDVEGFELEVWRGMARIIADNPDLAVIVELGPEHLQRAGVTIKTWLEELQRPGFVAFEIDEASGILAPLRSAASLQAAVSLNLLLLRKPPSAYPQLSFT